MSSTLCQDFGPIRLLNCPFNSHWQLWGQLRGISWYVSVKGVWGMCPTFCTDLYCLLCTAHPDESRIWKASQAYVQNAAIRCERWLQRLGRNIITLFSLILPALFLPWLIREQVGCDLKLVEHTCLRAAPLIHVEPTIAPAPPVCMPAASTVISTTVSRLTHSRPPFPFSSSFQMFGFIWWL